MQHIIDYKEFLQTPVIMWFRQDLRLTDNPALLAATQTRMPIIPLFIYDQETQSIKRFLGSASKWWLHYSLSALKSRLPDLCLRKGKTQEILDAIFKETGAKILFFNKINDDNFPDEDLILEKLKQTYNIEIYTFKGNIFHELQDILNHSGKPYQIFTSYWKHCTTNLSVNRPTPKPQNLHTISMNSETLESLGLLPRNPDWASNFYKNWTPGEQGAHEQLGQFLENKLGGYHRQRNFPDTQGTSRLSPHIHWGEISSNYIWHALEALQVQKIAHQDIECFKSELGWREFSYYMAYHFPQISTDPLRHEFLSLPWRNDPEGLKAWQKGLTGYPIVDAGMRELWSTGWMHNRLRMIVASFLTKHLLIPWQEGERWFWDTLVDADKAINATNWQWVAGCGIDSAPYFRIFNPILQGEKYDPKGTYVRKWVPELAALPDNYIHKPWLASATILRDAKVILGTTYPYPIVDLKIGRQRALEAYKEIRIKD